MYVELLAAVLDDRSEVQADDRLLTMALDCRSHVVEIRPHGRGSAHHALVVEVAYDRSLIKLCVATGIDADPARFENRHAERARLERELTAAAGVDLAALSRRWLPEV
jgi:hypothetical protein